MAYTHSRFGSTLALLLLGSTALGGPAQAGWLFGDSKKEVKKESGTESVKAGTVVQPAETLDGSIRQAQLLRVDGNYSEAIRHLSQLMMVASDDQRVISEYGKTLAAMGRASEALNFLTRAQQLQPEQPPVSIRVQVQRREQVVEQHFVPVPVRFQAIVQGVLIFGKVR